MARRARAESGTGTGVVLERPLLVESGAERPGMAGVMVVDCPVAVAVHRVVEQRGMDEAAVRARIAAQATRQERLERADLVIDNAGPPERLAPEVDRAWRWIEGLRATR